MPEILSIKDFLDKYEKEKLLLLDTRSEKEYEHAHIPGAVNLPLLNNEHRHLVGTDYKRNGRESAVALGFKLVGPHFHEFIEKANELSEKKEIMIYCWRGGMRSSIMSWVLSMAGFKTTLLKGGYKSFRRYILSQFSIPKKIIIVGGHTGSGKTEILIELRKKGEQVIDLEALANHRGSAFGRIGLPPQPSNEFFENMLGLQWSKITADKIVWLEGESRSIGSVKIPDEIFNQLQSSLLVEVMCSREFRKNRIIDEYGVFPKADLAECTAKLQKRLGHLRMTEALIALNDDRLNDWLDILLDYYDKNYSYSLQERTSKQRITVGVKDNNSIKEIACKILEITQSVKENSIT